MSRSICLLFGEIRGPWGPSRQATTPSRLQSCGDLVRRSRPAAAQQRVGVGDARRPARRYGRRARDRCRRAPGRAGGSAPCCGCSASTNARRGRAWCRSPAARRPRGPARRRCRCRARRATQSSRSRVANTRAEVGADRVLLRVVELVRGPLRQLEQRGRGWPRRPARSRRRSATCRRAPGRRRSRRSGRSGGRRPAPACAPVARCSSIVRRHEREHALGDRDVEVRALPALRERAAARRGWRSPRACRRRRVGDGRARERRTAVGASAAHREEAAVGEIVEIVPGPASTAARPARSRSSSSRRSRGFTARTSSKPMPSRAATPGRKLSITTCASRGELRGTPPCPRGAFRSICTRLRAAPGAVGEERRLDLHALLRRRRADLHDRRAVVGEDARAARRRPDAREVEHGDTVAESRDSLPMHASATQKFFGSPSFRRAMMFFWISEAPPPIVSITV